MVEILAPVGSKENLIVAINSGADAVYLGLTDFSARKSADNFDFDDLKYAISYAKTFGVKVYLTVNTLIKDLEINDFISAINKAYSYGVDAFILQDMFLGKYIKSIMPNVTLHLSTQAGICNEYGAKLAKKYGFSRVILARETKLDDIKKICKIIETEVFIQGALCTSFSGHCYFSSFVGGNSGNRGFCKQPCRKEYSYVVNGKTVKKGYLLSLSDLSIGEDIQLLKDIGVKSFKIEGRMRSKEYLSSAVLYYKSLLDGKNDKSLYDNLKISFNRGDYTKGLAFSQDKNFISDKIQNNVGLNIGKITSIFKDALKFSGDFNVSEGDAFKIVDNGFEVGNAIAVSINGKLQIKFKGNVKVGNLINVTKKADIVKLKNRFKELTVTVSIKVGEKLKLYCNDLFVESEGVILPAKTSPITKDEVILNLNKTDVYPYKINVEFKEFSSDAFIPKSAFNNLRAELYSKLFYEINLKKPYNIEKYEFISKSNDGGLALKNAVITSSLKGDFSSFNEVVYAPYDYNDFDNSVNYSTVWLYLPPYLSGADIEIIKPNLTKFKGIYADGVWAIELANELNLKLFAGVGFNVFNQINVLLLNQEDVFDICASKELSFNEIKNLPSDLYVLSGAVEIMDLIYCPFSKNCKNCDIINDFKLVDKEGRIFIVKRYKVSECRFKVYNMAKLKQNYNFNQIEDLTVSGIDGYTQGNYIKGIK